MTGNHPLDENSATLKNIRREVTNETVDVIIASADLLFQEGIAALIGQWGEFNVIGKPRDGRATLRMCIDNPHAVCLMNTQTKHKDYTKLVERIVELSPGTKIIVLAASGADNDVIEALRAGIHGYCIHSDITSDRLRGMIWGILSGGVMIYGLERSKLKSNSGKLELDEKGAASFDSLTKREMEVLGLLMQGYSNQEIGAQLFLSEATVKKNIAHITEKLQVSNRVQAAVLAAKYLS